MQLIKDTVNIPFVKYRKIAFTSSMIITVAFIAAILVNGFNLGIDFTGGVNIQVKFPLESNIDKVKSDIGAQFDGKSNVIQFGNRIDNEYMINIPSSEDEKLNEESVNFVSNYIKTNFSDAEIRSIETIGPTVGEELKMSSIYSILLILGVILLYTAIRFKIYYGVAALLALFHDSIFLLGIFSISGLTFDLTIVAAILTTIGYSLNDTVIVFDRIREIQSRHPFMDAKTLINTGINKTLSRTLVTSVTTLLVVLFLFLFGGPSISNFALTIILGILTGTYSSLFIACPVLVYIIGKTGEITEQTTEKTEGATV